MAATKSAQAKKRTPKPKRKFESGEKMLESLEKYIEVCESTNKLPNISGFVVYANIQRGHWYSFEKSDPDAFESAQEMLESAVISANVPPGLKIFYMKNKFGYADRSEWAAKFDGDLKISLNIPRPGDKKIDEP